MTCSYHRDLASSQEAIRLSRDELLRVIDALSRADFDRGRKGGWPVRRVLVHVIFSEQLYAQATAYLCGAQTPLRRETSEPGSPSEARTMLLDSRKTLLKALEELELDPMGYEKFYELRKVGHEEYSVLSVLENVANHDREHAEQIRGILTADN
jgi:DinB superfamily